MIIAAFGKGLELAPSIRVKFLKTVVSAGAEQTASSAGRIHLHRRLMVGDSITGRLTGAVGSAYTKDLDGLHIIDNCACFSLPVSDRGSPATERKGGRPGGSVRRYGLTDSVRSARLGHAAIESHDGFGDSVHADVADAFDSGDARDRCGKYNSREASRSGIDKATGDFDNNGSGAGSERSGTDNARIRRSETRTAVGNIDGSEDGREQNNAYRATAPAVSTTGAEEVGGRVRK
jgi:hypothetical protein